MEKKCILFTGLQASGKTTFYRLQFSRGKRLLSMAREMMHFAASLSIE